MFAPIVITWLVSIFLVGRYNMVHRNLKIVSALSPIYLLKLFIQIGKECWIYLERYSYVSVQIKLCLWILVIWQYWRWGLQLGLLYTIVWWYSIWAKLLSGLRILSLFISVFKSQYLVIYFGLFLLLPLH